MRLVLSRRANGFTHGPDPRDVGTDLESMMIYRSLWAVAVLTLGASAAVAMDSYTVTTAEVHEAADATSPVVATLPGGQRVALRRCENGWCLIGEPDVQGWVREADLQLRGGGA